MQSNTQSIPSNAAHTHTPVVQEPANSIAAVVPLAELPPTGQPAVVAQPAAAPQPVQSTPVASSGSAASPQVLPHIPAQTIALRQALSEQPVAQSGQRQWLRWTCYSVLGLLAIAGGGAYGMYASWRGGEQIAPQFYIQGEPVGGLTRLEARKRLEQRFGRLVHTIQTPHRTFMLSLEDLGGEPQINDAVNNAYWYGRSGNPFRNMWRLWQARQEEHRLKLPVEWNKDRLRRTMWTVATQYQMSPQDASLKVGEKGAEVVPHQEGRSINVGATLQNLQRGYYTGLPQSEAVVRTVMPRITSADLDGVDMKLGDYRTYFDSGLRGRTKNIRLAADALDGRVLMPGEEFSFNASTGERTSSKGYRIAHIFVRKPGESESEVVDGLGGGVCQVSSTLFNAVRRANRKAGKQLRILELNHHSLPVTYVPFGLDATVAWPHKDFKFRNKFSHPIYLRASVGGSRLNISVWGRVPNTGSATPSTQASSPAAQEVSNS